MEGEIEKRDKMDMEILFKKLLWLAFFAIVLFGIYVMFKKLGVMP